MLFKVGCMASSTALGKWKGHFGVSELPLGLIAKRYEQQLSKLTTHAAS